MTTNSIDAHETVVQAPAAEPAPRPIWLIVLGVVTVLTGVAAIVFPFASTLAAEIMVGSLFLTVGLFSTIHAFAERTWKAFIWELLIGALQIGAGVMFLVNPLGGIVVLTAMLGAVFAAEGLLRIVLGLQMRPDKGWGLIVGSGALSVVLGVLVFAGLSNGASLMLIGILMGVNFIFAGAATISLGVELQDVRATE